METRTFKVIIVIAILLGYIVMDYSFKKAAELGNEIKKGELENVRESFKGN